MIKAAARILTAIAVVAATPLAGVAHASPAAPVAAVTHQVSEAMAAHPGGTLIGPNVIEWNGGAVTMGFAGTTGREVTPQVSHVCADGFYCFYQDKDFNGSWLQFNICDGLPGNLTDWGFNDLLTSYWNNTGRFIDFYRDINAGGGLLLEVGPFSRGNVPSFVNDQISSFVC